MISNRVQTGFDYWAPIPQEELCVSCRKRRRAQGVRQCEKCNRHSALQGSCHKCGVPIKKRHTYCDACLSDGAAGVRIDLDPAWHKRVGNTMSGLRQRARHNNITTVATMGEVAALLKSQGYRCAMSGALLRPDRTTVLGHKTPASCGGGYDASNLFWITSEINRMMGTMDDKSFRRLCRDVAAHQD